MDNKVPQPITISAGSIIKILVILVLAYALFLLRDLVLIVLTAIVFASAIEPGARKLESYRLPRVLAVLLIYIVGALFIFGVFYFVVPQFLEELSNFLARIPTYLDTSELLQTFEGLKEFNVEGSQVVVQGLQETINARIVLDNLSDYITRIPGGAFNLISAVFGGVVSFMLIVILSFYLAVQREGIENLLRIVVPHKHRDYAVDLWERAKSRIGKWMQGQLLLMAIIGVLTFLGLTILGVQHALLLAIFAGMFELIPLFGPIIASIPAIIVSFGAGGISLAALVAGLYIIIQQFENQLIYPLVVHKVVGVPALVVILALIAGGSLAGFLGIVLAVPVATALMELATDLQKRGNKPEKTGM